MSRLVVDTNCLIQIISKRSRYHDLWLSFIDGRNKLCVSTDILNEYEEILSYKASPLFASLALKVITNNPNTIFVTPYFNFELIKSDPDDNKFVDCAISANAKFIVTEDHHFDILKGLKFPPLSVIGIDEFIYILDSFSHNMMLNEPEIVYHTKSK